LPSPNAGPEEWFNIIIDPWLTGPQADFHKRFSQQWHVIKPCVENVNDLGIRIDAVIVSHEFTDHCHRATLETIDSKVPVYATTVCAPTILRDMTDISEQKAAQLIRSWSHFDKVVDIPALLVGQSWTTTSIRPLPPWLGISRIASKSFDPAYYHSAILITYLPTPNAGAQAIIYTPRGIPSSSLSLEQFTSSGIDGVTALLHGLHELWNPWWLGGKLNLGGQNGLQVVRQTGAKYWIGTHDEVKKGGGFVAWVLKRRIWGVDEVMKREGMVDNGEMSLKHVTLESGDSIELA
jgi:hypothetical protein